MSKQIADLLLKEKIITEKQRADAIKKHETNGGSVGQTLVLIGAIDSSQLAQATAKSLGIKYVDIKSFEFAPESTLKLPENFARRYNAIILSEQEDHYLIGMSDPLDIFSYDEISSKLDKPIKLAVVIEKDMSYAMDLVYRHREEISGFAEELSDEISSRGAEISDLSVDIGAESKMKCEKV